MSLILSNTFLATLTLFLFSAPIINRQLINENKEPPDERNSNILGSGNDENGEPNEEPNKGNDLSCYILLLSMTLSIIISYVIFVLNPMKTTNLLILYAPALLILVIGYSVPLVLFQTLNDPPIPIIILFSLWFLCLVAVGTWLHESGRNYLWKIGFIFFHTFICFTSAIPIFMQGCNRNRDTAIIKLNEIQVIMLPFLSPFIMGVLLAINGNTIGLIRRDETQKKIKKDDRIEKEKRDRDKNPMGVWKEGEEYEEDEEYEIDKADSWNVNGVSETGNQNQSDSIWARILNLIYGDSNIVKEEVKNEQELKSDGVHSWISLQNSENKKQIENLKGKLKKVRKATNQNEILKFVNSFDPKEIQKDMDGFIQIHHDIKDHITTVEEFNLTQETETFEQAFTSQLSMFKDYMAIENPETASMIFGVLLSSFIAAEVFDYAVKYNYSAIPSKTLNLWQTFKGKFMGPATSPTEDNGSILKRIDENESEKSSFLKFLSWGKIQEYFIGVTGNGKVYDNNLNGFVGLIQMDILYCKRHIGILETLESPQGLKTNFTKEQSHLVLAKALLLKDGANIIGDNIPLGDKLRRASADITYDIIKNYHANTKGINVASNISEYLSRILDQMWNELIEPVKGSIDERRLRELSIVLAKINFQNSIEIEDKTKLVLEAVEIMTTQRNIINVNIEESVLDIKNLNNTLEYLKDYSSVSDELGILKKAEVDNLLLPATVEELKKKSTLFEKGLLKHHSVADTIKAHMQYAQQLANKGEASLMNEINEISNSEDEKKFQENLKHVEEDKI